MPSQPSVLDALGAVVALIERVPDPAERIVAVRRVRAELAHEDDRLRSITVAAIGELRASDPPATWDAIGVLLEASGAYAHKLYTTNQPERPQQ